MESDLPVLRIGRHPSASDPDDLGFFSVYNNLLERGKHGASPLRFLEPESRDSGWHVSRNLLKPLNHLDFLRRKDEIATALNLHSLRTPPEVFDQNFALLERHQARLVSTAAVIEAIIRQVRADGRRLDTSDVRAMLAEYASVRHMEFHPTDVCNLSCNGCTYGHDDPLTKPLPVNFNFGSIRRIAEFRPRSLVLIGGGEPTLYRQGPNRFQDVVDELSATNRGLTMALTTNGTLKPGGNWPDKMSWIRVSLDAATPETYAAFRGKRQFHKVIANYLSYLDHAVPYVGVSFLFAKSNIHECAAVAKLIYDTVLTEKPQMLPKVNIQYRPLRRDPHDFTRPFTDALSKADIARAVADITALAESSPGVEDFLRNQTNVTAVLGGNSHPPHEFSRCHYSQTFRIVRANGDLRPCFIRVTEPDFVLGNIETDPLETVALNTLYIGARRKPDCDPHGCRQCHVNYTFAKGLSGELTPSMSPAVRADPMY